MCLPQVGIMQGMRNLENMLGRWCALISGDFFNFSGDNFGDFFISGDFDFPDGDLFLSGDLMGVIFFFSGDFFIEGLSNMENDFVLTGTFASFFMSCNLL